jgi:nucleoside-diphosphate-sugar epimerase
MVGKWHLCPTDEMNLASTRRNWPTGRGFERWYGFLGAETNQWYPDLVYDNHPVDQPKTPDEGYHLTEDITDKALEFIFDNLSIQTNLIDAAYRAGAAKFLFLGSSCIYPKLAPQPLKEEYLLTGPLEPTNEWYAIAKIAGIKMAQAYRRQYGFRAISLMPTNLYGPEDNFDLNTSHVLPALIRKFHEATRDGSPQVVIWGTGSPRREFLHVDDLADARGLFRRALHDPLPTTA